MAANYGTHVVPADGAWHDLTAAVPVGALTAAGVAGIEWQNVGGYQLLIAFSDAVPVDATGRRLLNPSVAFTDGTGSDHIWVKAIGGPANISGMGV